MTLTNDLASHLKQIDKQQLANLAHLGNAESAGRMFRGVKAKIIAALVDLSTPKNGDGGNDDAAAAAAADPESPSVLASQKKKNKNKASGGKVAGRKRNIKAAQDDSSGDEGGERPSKIPKHVKGKSIFTLKKEEAAEGSADDLETGEI